MIRIVYRIEEKNGKFYPQERGWLYGWNYFEYSVQGMMYDTEYLKVKFNSLEEAKEYIKNLNTTKSEEKYHYVY